MSTEYEIGTPDYYSRKEREHKTVMFDLMKRNAKMRAALMLIAEFQEPAINFQMNYGSNGMRDHFKGIAENALK